MTAFIKKSRIPVVICLAVAFIFSLLAINNQIRAKAAMYAPTARDVQVVLMRLGLDPEHLAAAGVSTRDAANIAEDALASMVASPGQLTQADRVWSELRRQVDLLRRVVRSGRASPEQVTAFQDATGQMETARIQRVTVLNDMRADATTHLSNAQQSILSALRRNEEWKLPLEFLAVDREERDWIALRNDLANERIAAKEGETPDSQAQTRLASARSNPTVSTAKAGIDANSDAIASACDEALLN